MVRGGPAASVSAAAARALQRIDQHHQAGDVRACLQAMRALATEADEQPGLLQELGLRYTLLGRHADAERCYAQAVALRPADPSCLYNHATALLALGRLAEAESTLD